MDGYPHILTIKYNDRGCNLMHINCCIRRTNIPSPVYDQVLYAFVKPLTVNRTEVGYNYTRYQMVEQQSSWKVPDTVNVSHFNSMI